MSSTKRIGNWTPDGKVERARLQRDYLELSGAERMKQVVDGDVEFLAPYFPVR